jgi:transcriptional regulator with XRE-family HTH domain
MATLQQRSGIPIQALAQQADLSPSYVSRVLTGDRVPAWPVLHMLASILGGRPAELRLLWEQAQGVTRPPRQAVAEAAARVTAALRGLYLAAGEPDLGALCGVRSGLMAEEAQAVLRGDTVPDWETVSTLSALLGGHPADLRPWWEDLHYACLASALPGVIPPHGLVRTGVIESSDRKENEE